MAQIRTEFSTGLPSLDRVLRGLTPGDNVVWQVDSIEDYRAFVQPYVRNALDTGKNFTYFRFARHEPLLPLDLEGARVVQLHPEAGFEHFITEVHQAIEEAGRLGVYVFDCLSELAADWYSDRMLGNFFMLTCPYLYDLETLAYFALLRNHHSANAIDPITSTTQLFLDVYRHAGRLYVHPIKVQQRYSPTMFTLHGRDGDEFAPVQESATIAEVLTSVPWARVETGSYRTGIWDRTFNEAEELLGATRRRTGSPEDEQRLFRRLLRMGVSRDERVLALAGKCLTLPDLVSIRRRMIGTGLIGGKSVGMLLARAILRKAAPRWVKLLEPHDSFFIGSDVFYTFLVGNGVWWVRQRQRDPERFLDGAEEARRRMLTGSFPEEIADQFEAMLDYFGQSPIIVRSSSLLEDNFGNAFAGKYESVFCPNQGPRQKRLEDFLSAVRTVYASTMSEKALRYRETRGMLDRDEQMALLVQRVSGLTYGHLFYPQTAGVGYSFNPYAWNESIDPEAGVMRLVLGLGTRAVDRTDDDYTRLVALNAPERRPESSREETRQYAQRRMDVIDLEANRLLSTEFRSVATESPGLPLDLFATRDVEMERRAADAGTTAAFPWTLTFDRLLKETPFVKDVRDMLHILQDAYDYPVDVEFTMNLTREGPYRINLVQCRPFQVKGGGAPMEPPADVAEEDLVLRGRGPVIGPSRLMKIDRVIYIVPKAYGELPTAERYTVARLIGRLTRQEGPSQRRSIWLLGPGRWGTTTPSLGVPVAFADISRVSVLCEIVAMREDLTPDVSFGTHFFSEIVEMDILYHALFPHREGNILNRELLETAPNLLPDLLPDAEDWAGVIRVMDTEAMREGRDLRLNANAVHQLTVCYFD